MKAWKRTDDPPTAVISRSGPIRAGLLNREFVFLRISVPPWQIRYFSSIDLCSFTGFAFFRIRMFSISTTVEKAMAK